MERLAARGFDAHPIDARIEAIEHDDWKANGARASLAASTAVFVSRAPHDADDLRAAIDGVDPDLLVIDINAWGAIAVAEGSGRPWAAVAPYLLPISSPDAPPFGPGLAPARGPLGRLRDAIARPLVIGAVERAILPRLNEVRRTIDSRLPAIRSADELYARPPLLLSLTAEPFEYHRRSWPGNVRMVGPCAWEPELPPPAWLETLEPPIVLVATSSEYQADAILAQTAFDALAGTEMSVIATLPSNDPDALRVPTNGRAERFVPHGPILARASVAITHGGMGVTQKALAAGVPVVVVPFGRDQPEVARRVEVCRGRRAPASCSASAGHVASRRRHRDGSSPGRFGGRRRLSCGGRSGGCRLPPRGAARGTHIVTWLDRADRRPSLLPGWDRRNPWTLRFVDPELERRYAAAMAEPGRQRLRIAMAVGIGIWITAGIIGPPLLDIPAPPFYAAAAVMVAWLTFVIFLTLRGISLAWVWALAVITQVLSTVNVAVALGTVQLFVSGGAPALMTGLAFGIALVRPAAWTAAVQSAITIVLFTTIVLVDLSGVGAFQTFLLGGLAAGVTIGARYLEAGERTAFAQALLVADLHRRIDRLFRQYLSPDVAQALVDDPSRANLGGEVAEVSVLFADLQGFTSFSERTPAPQVVAMLNDAFGVAVPAVFAEGGTVVQFMGDGLMAVFNAPIRQADHALRACRAGMALQQAMGGDGADGTPRFRVGINTGPALVGNVGSEEMHNFLAIGDTTNVAARLQSLAPPGSVVLGQKTYDLVRDGVDVRSLGTPDLKGKSLPTEVFELVGFHTNPK